MNSPIQGTAADIIKLAMVRVAQGLKEGGYRARLILQVHDELVVECPHLDSLGVDEEPVRQGGLSVVHVGDDGEVSYM